MAKKSKTRRLRRNKAGKAVSILRKAFDDALKARCFSEVWRLVSAMRGPDVDDDEAKKAGTRPIRDACLPDNKKICDIWALRRRGKRGWYPEDIDEGNWTAVKVGWHCHAHLRGASDLLHKAYGTTQADEGTAQSDEGQA